MFIKEEKKPKFTRIAYNDKTRFEEELDSLVGKGWTVKRVWIKHNCFIADLTKPVKN